MSNYAISKALTVILLVGLTIDSAVLTYECGIKLARSEDGIATIIQTSYDGTQFNQNNYALIQLGPNSTWNG